MVTVFNRYPMYIHVHVCTSIGVDIEFTETSYTFNEYDGTVEVCAATVNDTTYNTSISISVTSEETESASGKLVLWYWEMGKRRGEEKRQAHMLCIVSLLLYRRNRLQCEHA